MSDVPAAVDEESRQAVRPAGKFRIYLGSAAGVGKTCAMLDEGWRRHNRGADVVVGFVETHGRSHTAELIRDLEVVPRTVVEYRGATFEEMDLAAVLERRPEVALVDELAHTNVPGSGPHEKRWEDVLDLLEAGIGVVSTVNIQHLESVADAVEEITGVKIRERVPDWVVRKADQVELIDSSADQLRRRMLHGNIYPSDKVPGALTGFFKTENLVALRELALRFVADETEEELLGYLRNQRPGAFWDTSERIMVAVTGAPGSDGVVRRAARIAQRTKGDLLVVHVTSEEQGGAGGPGPGGHPPAGGRRRRGVVRDPRRRPGPEGVRVRRAAPRHPDRHRGHPAKSLAGAHEGFGDPKDPALHGRVRHRPPRDRPP